MTEEFNEIWSKYTYSTSRQFNKKNDRTNYRKKYIANLCSNNKMEQDVKMKDENESSKLYGYSPFNYYRPNENNALNLRLDKLEQRLNKILDIVENGKISNKVPDETQSFFNNNNSDKYVHYKDKDKDEEEKEKEKENKNENKNKNKNKIKTMYIMRGIPGCGKSTWAREELLNQLSVENCDFTNKDLFKLHILSVDDFFYHEGRDGNVVFKFDTRDLQEYHECNKHRAKINCCLHISPLFIDNINISYEQMRPYMEIANFHNYKIIIVEPEYYNPKAFDIDDLMKSHRNRKHTSRITKNNLMKRYKKKKFIKYHLKGINSYNRSNISFYEKK